MCLSFSNSLIIKCYWTVNVCIRMDAGLDNYCHVYQSVWLCLSCERERRVASFLLILKSNILLKDLLSEFINKQAVLKLLISIP